MMVGRQESRSQAVPCLICQNYTATLLRSPVRTRITSRWRTAWQAPTTFSRIGGLTAPPES
jgi:hypothetical protein